MATKCRQLRSVRIEIQQPVNPAQEVILGNVILVSEPIKQVLLLSSARAFLSGLPEVDWLLADRGYDAHWSGEALRDKVIRPCIPGSKATQKDYEVRPAAVQMPQSEQDHGERLAACSNALRQMPEGLPVSHRTDRFSQLLVSGLILAAAIREAVAIPSIYSAVQDAHSASASRNLAVAGL